MHILKVVMMRSLCARHCDCIQTCSSSPKEAAALNHPGPPAYGHRHGAPAPAPRHEPQAHGRLYGPPAPAHHHDGEEGGLVPKQPGGWTLVHQAEGKAVAPATSTVQMLKRIHLLIEQDTIFTVVSSPGLRYRTVDYSLPSVDHWQLYSYPAQIHLSVPHVGSQQCYLSVLSDSAEHCTDAPQQ